MIRSTEKMRASRRNNYCVLITPEGKAPTWPATAVVLKGSVPLWTKGSAAGNAQHVWRKAPTSLWQFFSVATCAPPGIIGMGNCFRTRIWSAGDAFLAPPGSRTLAPFFRPTAQTGALFARAVVCATVTSSARVLSMVLVASRGRRTNVVAWVNLFWHLQAILPIPQQNLFDTLCRELSSNFTSPAPTTCA